MARVYSLKVSMTSGARYHLYDNESDSADDDESSGRDLLWTHRVATYSVMNVLVSSASGGGLADLASPKSQIWGWNSCVKSNNAEDVFVP
jgi:hypothetical protein